MADVLIADIGGTTSRVGFVGADGQPRDVVIVANDTLGGVEDLLTRALAARPAPRAAVLAVAAPVAGDDFTLTNRGWRIRPSALAARFGFVTLRVVNDFEALAHALPHLEADDLQPLGPLQSFGAAVRLVIGPGTGLGVAALLPAGDGWQVLSSEGGHASFGPAFADEEAVFRRLAEAGAPLSAESILSGRGLTRLHAAMHPGTMSLQPEMLMRQARAGDREARASVTMFVRLLGRFAGDMALTFKATGGVYIAGGVAMALGAMIDARLFRSAFERHPPYETLLQGIAAALITTPEPGLIGCAALARTLLRES
jgi:glucokinase